MRRIEHLLSGRKFEISVMVSPGGRTIIQMTQRQGSAFSGFRSAFSGFPFSI
jgi:hypothetical protein